MPWYRVCAVLGAGAASACGGGPGVGTDGVGVSVYPPAAATSSSPNPASNPTTDPAVGTTTSCVQGTLRSCVVPLPAQGGIHNCFTGKQLCTAGAWTDCKDPSTLVGLRSQQFVASCPATYVPRWTTLAYSVDAPANASGGAAVTIALAEHPEVVLLDTRAEDGVAPKGGAGTRDVQALLGAFSSDSTLILQVLTSTTPDGDLASTATLSADYSCVSGSAP